MQDADRAALRPVRRSMLCAIASVAGASLAGIAGRAVPAVVDLGGPAPALRGTLFSGERFDLAEQRGRVVLVNFYSSYCGICAREIGTLEAALESLGPRGLVVVMVSVDPASDLERTRRFVDNYSLPGMLADSLEASGFERRYPTPTCYTVDAAGVVRDKRVGAKTAGWLRETVVPLLPR